MNTIFSKGIKDIFFHLFHVKWEKKNLKKPAQLLLLIFFVEKSHFGAKMKSYHTFSSTVQIVHLKDTLQLFAKDKEKDANSHCFEIVCELPS